MPYYHGPRIITPSNSNECSDANHCQAIISTVMVDNCHGLCHLSNIPVKFGKFGWVTPSTSRSLNNYKFPCYALQVLQFSWAVYSFQGRHFAMTIQSHNLPFHVKLACDPFESGCSLFQEFTSCRQVFGTANKMLNYIWSLGDTSIVHGYMMHSPCYRDSKTTTKFWQIQGAIISDLRLIRSLWIVIATIHPDHNGRSVKTFTSNLKLKVLGCFVRRCSIPRFGRHNCWTLLHCHCRSLIFCFCCQAPATQMATIDPSRPSWQVHLGTVQPQGACNLVGL